MTPQERARRGMPCFEKLIRDYWFETVLDVGCGPDAPHARRFIEAGKRVALVDPQAPELPGAWISRQKIPPAAVPPWTADVLWLSHTLEHQAAPRRFLGYCREALYPGSILAITVPPLKHEIVTGHLTLWNAGLLLYHLVLAGFDCSEAAVRSVDYDVSVIVPYKPVPAMVLDGEPMLANLAPFFPVPVREGFDGRIKEVNW